jgi:hypothetical protein
VTGTVALGNAGHGVAITSGSAMNRIGTDGDGIADLAELISDNTASIVGYQGRGAAS